MRVAPLGAARKLDNILVFIAVLLQSPWTRASYTAFCLCRTETSIFASLKLYNL